MNDINFEGNSIVSLVSIIIPTFNSEQFISVLVDSLLAQTYKNIELIFCDDGSTDSTCQIIEDIQKSDSRVILIKQSNSGVVKARYNAFLQAKGEFITFVDSDDYLSINAIESMYTMALKYNADHVISQYTSFDTHGNVQEMLMDEYLSREKNKKVLRPEFIFEGMTHCSVWAKLYRKSSLDKECFLVGENFNVGEDYLFSLKYSIKEPSCVFIEQNTYFYRMRKNSVTSKKLITLNYYKKFRSKVAEIIAEHPESNKLIDKVKKNYLSGLLSLITPSFVRLQKIDEISDVIEEIMHHSHDVSYLSKKDKCILLMVKLLRHPFLVRFACVCIFEPLIYLKTKNYY